MRLAIAAALAAAAASAVGVDAAPLESRIVFQRMVGKQSELFSVRPDGRGLKRLTRASDNDVQPVWAPDRRRLVALRGSGLVVRRRNGAVIRSIPVRVGTSTSEPRWSPNGRWISYLVERCEDPNDPRGWWSQPGCADLWIVGADGSRRRRLVEARVDTVSGSPSYAWSPDSQTIVYQAIVRRLVRVDVRSARRQPVPNAHSIYAAHPSVSPDGRWIAFARQRAPFAGADLHKIRADGSGLRRVARGRNVSRSRWSPDGRLIAYYVAESPDPDTGDARYGLFVVQPDGTARRRLATTTDDRALVWSPDSSRIAWAGELPDAWIYVVGADGHGRPARVARGSEPDWR